MRALAGITLLRDGREHGRFSQCTSPQGLLEKFNNYHITLAK